MKIYIGITDKEWYEFLYNKRPDEVNFWKPGSSSFKALEPNEMFLFKLHHPYNYIVGGGFFVRFLLLPSFLAWKAFETNNGVSSYEDLIKRIEKYRGRNSRNNLEMHNRQIGCVILTEPFFFSEGEWISVPEDWSPCIVQGKTYDTNTEIGHKIYQEVSSRLGYHGMETLANGPRYSEVLMRHRLGQGAFRVLVTEAYQHRCSVTGEKTLPVLEAAHIRPYSENGPNKVSNGILLRSDIHTLFDNGYITISPNLHVEVSHKLQEDYGNGKDYYKYHGSKMLVVPSVRAELPSREFVEWHNEYCYKG